METQMNNKQLARIMRKKMENALAMEVEQLLSCHENEGLRWKGTNIDLMEALHTAFTTGLIVDERGCLLSFTTIVSRACTVLHRRKPSNPYECATRGRNRKGVTQRTYMERYAYMLKQIEQPLWTDICI